MTDYDEQVRQLHAQRAQADSQVINLTKHANFWTQRRTQIESDILELAAQKIAEQRDVKVQKLMDEHIGYAWVDKDGDRWEYHDGKWLCDEGGATTDFAPYTRVEAVEELTGAHRGYAWLDADGDRWEYRDGEWHWRKQGYRTWRKASNIAPPLSVSPPYTRVDA